MSILINNHNYARFLDDAISSALEQSYPRKEVIVVDDGSVDNSREVIDRYGDKIVRIYKENGGQASAINAGFLQSHGDLLFFLDADDILERDVVEQAVQRWDGKATKLHFRLDIIDNNGTVIGHDPASNLELPQGNIRPSLLSHGHYVTPAGSGNVYSRKFVQAVLPIPEEPFRRAADSYLYTLAPLHGDILSLPRAGGKYRMHGNNGYLKKRRFSTPKDLQGVLQRYERCLALIDHFVEANKLERTYSPKYYGAPNFTRLLLRRVERKLDYTTTFYLMGNIFYAIFADKTSSTKQRAAEIGKALLVAFAPLPVVWRIYPNTRPGPQLPSHNVVNALKGN